MTDRSAGTPLWLRRTGWLLAIWAISVAGLAIVALAFRLLMRSAGLTD